MNRKNKLSPYKLNDNDIETLLEEIPSDDNSIVSDDYDSDKDPAYSPTGTGNQQARREVLLFSSSDEDESTDEDESVLQQPQPSTSAIQQPEANSSLTSASPSVVWFTGESNSHITLHESHQHCKVNFLHIYCYSAYIAYIPLDSRGLEYGPTCTTPKGFWAVTTNCDHCTIPITEQPSIFDSTWIANLSLHKLAISSVTSHATSTLDESIITFLRDPVVALNVQFRLDRQSATFGILQELAEICLVFQEETQRYVWCSQSEQHVTGGSVGTKDVISHQRDDERGKERYRVLPLVDRQEFVFSTTPYPSFTSQNHTPHGNPVRPIPTSPANTPCPNPNTINLKV
ncbi:hypothetical protein M8J76_009807 [Diaphorina citri]|nr:hypothetical protein M8J76_009807 [Diaphorina citri]